MYQRRHHSRGPGLALALLAGQMAQVGFDRIPPITLIGIIGQVVAHLRLFNIRWPHVNEVCISAVNVWYKQDYQRLFLGAFFHADEWHLYFNMVSLLWKGIRLEPQVGSRYFLYMISVFTVLTNVLYVGIGLAAEHWLHDHSYISQCAVGFSGVLFALKVVTTHMTPGSQRILGFIPVPSRYACWAELILIHILVPRSSFVGHLSGILIGLLYVKGPLKSLMETLIQPEASSQGMRSGVNSMFTRRRFRDWGSSDRDDTYTPNTRGQQDTHDTHTNQQDTHDTHPSQYQTYTGGMTEGEQMQHAMRESLRQPAGGFTQPRETRPAPSAPPVTDDDLPPPPYPGTTGPASAPPYPTDDTQPRLYPDLSAANRGEKGTDGTAESPSVRAGELGNRGGGTTQRTAATSPSVSAEEVRRRRLQRFS